MKGNNIKTVWVGFCDGKPHTQSTGDHNPDYCVCSSKKQAQAMYEDVRKAWLVWPVTSKRKRRSGNGTAEGVK